MFFKLLKMGTESSGNRWCVKYSLQNPGLGLLVPQEYIIRVIDTLGDNTHQAAVAINLFSLIR
jgi:hypothetical protein